MRFKKALIGLSLFLALALISMANHRTNDGDNKKLSKERSVIINNENTGNCIPTPIGDAVTSGMNIVIFKPIEDNKKGVNYQLKQEMFNKKVNGKSVPNDNTIFVLQYDFKLVEDINIPKDCILKFEGGSIGGDYTLTGNNTSIEAGLVRIFDTSIILKGKWNVIDLYSEWFGAKGDGIADDYMALQHTINIASTSNTGIYSVKLVNTKSYNVSKHVEVPPRIVLCSSFSNRDKSYDGRNKPKIVVTSNDDAIHLVTEKGLGNSLGFIVLSNIALIGKSPTSSKGIVCKDKNAKYIEKCRFSGLYISNFKYGIYVEGDEYVLNGNVIDDLSIQKNVGLCVFVHTKDIYDLMIENTHFFQPYIGGVLIETHNITTPVTFRNCVMEGCGREYFLQDYNKYGCFAISVKSNSDLESVNVDECYFEANAPIKKYKKGSQPSSFEKIATNNNEVYINKPNWDITADIIIDGPQVTINNSVFSELYQMIAINNSGKLVFNNNVLYVPDGWRQYEMYTNSIVRVNDNKNYCSNISISIDLLNLTKESLGNTKIKDLNEITLAEGTYAQRINVNVNIPALDKKYFYASTSSGISTTPILYYNSNALDNGIGTSFAPFKYFDTLLNYARSVFDYNETITVLLISDVIITKELNVPTGLNFSFKTAFKAKTIELKQPLSVCGSNLYFNNVKIKHSISGSSQSGFILDDCNVYLKNSDIYLNSDSCLFSGLGDNKVIFEDCSILSHSNTAHYLKNASNNSTRIEMKGKTTKSSNIM